MSNLSPNTYDMPMKWYRALTGFILWLGAILNTVTGIQLLTGNVYGSKEEAELVYGVFDSLKSIDTIFGIAIIGCAVYAIYVRSQLVKFSAKAPKCIVSMYLFVAAVEVIYCVCVNSAISEYGASTASISSELTSQAITQVVVGLIMAFANHTYFKKRQHMFTN